jgi:CDP-paratose 2-epimerase
MRILITGGCGFIGSTLAISLKLKYSNYTIIALDNLKRRGSELNVLRLQEHDISFIHGDIRNMEDLEGLPEFDLMIDAAAEPSVLSGLDGNPNYVIQNNLQGTINCLNICVKKHARFIFLSTSRIYPIEPIEQAQFTEHETRFVFSDNQHFEGISKYGISEKMNLKGYRSFYGTTKLSAELLIEEYRQFYNLNAIITRFGVVAGPYQMGKTDQGVAALWMIKHYFKQPLSYIGYGGTGRQVRDILHVDDLVDLIDLQIHEPQLFETSTFNAGGGLKNSVSLIEMTEWCREISGNNVEIYSDPITRKADLKNYTSDIRYITQQTPWRIKKDVKNIFSDIFSWIHQNESQVKQFIG